MQANVGSLDRGLRVALGLALLTAAFTGLLGPWAYLGVVPLLTGVFRFCPAYLPFGVSTCPRR